MGHDTNIDGVKVKSLDRNVDERGELTEIFRKDWPEFYEPEPKMSYVSHTYPHVVRAWNRHKEGQVDYMVVLKGNMKIVVYDDREGSATRGEIDEFVIGERNMKAVRIPGDCWHGVKCIGDKTSVHVNLPSELYDYKNPDEDELDPFENDIPYNWRLEEKTR